MTKNEHLPQNQIIKATIDIQDIDSKALKHIETCSQCQEKIKVFSQDLNTISKMATDISYPPKPKIESLILLKRSKLNFHGPIFKPLIAFSFFVCILATILIFQNGINPTIISEQKPYHTDEFRTDTAFVFDKKAFEYFGLSDVNYEDEKKKANFDNFINSLIHFDDEIIDITLFQILYKEVKK